MATDSRRDAANDGAHRGGDAHGAHAFVMDDDGDGCARQGVKVIRFLLLLLSMLTLTTRLFKMLNLRVVTSRRGVESNDAIVHLGAETLGVDFALDHGEGEHVDAGGHVGRGVPVGFERATHSV